ncbi:unnamed protein product [Notodromas monacha]|uniref:Uncharacterized protein n=1 Tax=Notodromas monacha TaxID=399045 RepID=A0A7R9BJ73_9CRUS|nr:unnamed protein product [Notodromas monacha]CAG0915627.1 unnamed protein product [Notodromas monacha]
MERNKASYEKRCGGIRETLGDEYPHLGTYESLQIGSEKQQESSLSPLEIFAYAPAGSGPPPARGHFTARATLEPGPPLGSPQEKEDNLERRLELLTGELRGILDIDGEFYYFRFEESV